MKKAVAISCYFFVLIFMGSTIPLKAQDNVRVASLKFGTVNWVLETIKRHKLDKKYKFNMSVVPLASANGAKIALQGNSADIVVTDWMWVSRRRADGAPFTLVPYSSSAGHLMVAAQSDIKTLEDLRGKKIGVAGGPLDKSWLFFRAYTKKKIGIDIADIATPVYGSPPLLANKMQRGEFDAILNFWHYTARLEAKGFRSLVSVKDMMASLGASGPTVTIGFAFSDKWANENEAMVKGFLAAVREAVAMLDRDEKVWQEVRPLMKVKDQATFEALQTSFRAGILRRPLLMEQADVGRLYSVLVELGGKKLVGKATNLSPGTFWLVGDVSQPVTQDEVN